MSQQDLPFFESDKAATKYAIQAAGKTIKEVGHALWPNKTVERAATDLNAALNENRTEQLSTDEHAFVANFCGRFDWLYYASHQCSHSRPEPIAPEDMRAKLQRDVISAVQHLDGIAKRLERLGFPLRAAS